MTKVRPFYTGAQSGSVPAMFRSCTKPIVQRPKLSSQELEAIKARHNQRLSLIRECHNRNISITELKNLSPNPSQENRDAWKDTAFQKKVSCTIETLIPKRTQLFVEENGIETNQGNTQNLPMYSEQLVVNLTFSSPYLEKFNTNRCLEQGMSNSVTALNIENNVLNMNESSKKSKSILGNSQNYINHSEIKSDKDLLNNLSVNSRNIKKGSLLHKNIIENPDKNNLNFDIDLIENKMSNLTITELNARKENKKRTLSHNLRLQSLREFVGKDETHTNKSRPSKLNEFADRRNGMIINNTRLQSFKKMIQNHLSKNENNFAEYISREIENENRLLRQNSVLQNANTSMRTSNRINKRIRSFSTSSYLDRANNSKGHKLKKVQGLEDHGEEIGMVPDSCSSYPSSDGFSKQILKKTVKKSKQQQHKNTFDTKSELLESKEDANAEQNNTYLLTTRQFINNPVSSDIAPSDSSSVVSFNRTQAHELRRRLKLGSISRVRSSSGSSEHKPTEKAINEVKLGFDLNKNTVVSIVSDTNAGPLECKHIKVESMGEVQHLLEKFPFPKNILHSYYYSLSEELKDKSLRVEPIYKCIKTKHNSEWNCFYHLKWPENCKIQSHALTKKRASSMAALKCLQYLSENGKIASDGSPLIYTKEEVKKISLKTIPQISFDEKVITKMQNIIDIFSSNMSSVINKMDYNQHEDEHYDVVDKEIDSINSFLSNPPKYLGLHRYLAKEKIELPITNYKESFIQMIQNNNCVIVKGEPGCGKSSRVPQYVLEAWAREASSDNELCRIAVTQPRRIAAISLAERVASERNEEVGHIVGYQVRLKSKFMPRTGRIFYCTTGILLRHLQSDPNLTKFSHVILDEAHERDVNTDLLMNLMKKAMKENDNLRVIVMSATIDAEEFSDYFNKAPVFQVPGFAYPVKKHFLDNCKLSVEKTWKMCSGEYPNIIHEDVAEIIRYIHANKPEGAILTFLPGWEDLVKVSKLISNLDNVAVYMVHSKLKDSEQHKIFSKPPPGIRKIILATNIAETSITIDDVVYVVDSGMHKDQVFDNDKGINVLDMEWISKASANQRAGRAGRCSPGEAYHLYTRERLEKFQDFSTPKILNSSLTKVILDSKMFTNNMAACDFMNSLITPPENIAVERAVDELKQLKLLDENEKLTPLGRTLVGFQLEPRLAKVLVNAVIFKCVSPIVDIVTLFSSDAGIFGSMDLTNKDHVKSVKSQFCKSSDHLALMRVYEKWLELIEESGWARGNNFCTEANLVPYKLDFVTKLKAIHFEYLQNGLYDSMPISEKLSDNDELVKAILYSGAGTVLQHRNWDIVKNKFKSNTNVLVTRNNQKATISSESVNYKRHKFPSDFLVYINETRSNIRRTTIVRECSLIPAISVLLFSGGELEILKAKPETENCNQVSIGVKNTKLQFLCDKGAANVLLNCKQAIDLSYTYLIHQLTYAGEDIPEFLGHWDDVLQNLNDILEHVRIE